MQSCLFQRDNNGATDLFQLGKRALRGFEISAQQKQHWRFLGNRAPDLALKASSGARSKSVKIHRGMLRANVARAIRKLLLGIVAARVENSEPETSGNRWPSVVRIECFWGSVFQNRTFWDLVHRTYWLRASDFDGSLWCRLDRQSFEYRFRWIRHSVLRRGLRRLPIFWWRLNRLWLLRRSDRVVRVIFSQQRRAFRDHCRNLTRIDRQRGPRPITSRQLANQPAAGLTMNVARFS